MKTMPSSSFTTPFTYSMPFGNYDIAVRPFDDFMDCVHDKGHGSCCRPGNEQVVTQFYFFRGIFA